MNDAKANLTHLVHPEQFDAAEVYQGFQAGGGGLVKTKPLILTNASCHQQGQAVQITFDQSNAWVQALTGLLDLPLDWQPYEQLVFKIQAGDQPILIEAMAVGARNRLWRRIQLDPGQVKTLTIDLVDLPLTAGIRAAYKPTGIRFVGLWGGDEGLTDWDLVQRTENPFKHHPDIPQGPRSVLVHEITLVPRPEDAEQRPCVDRYGQRANTWWPGKVTDDSQLKSFREIELEELDRWFTPHPGRDRFGGWTDGPKQEATGFFRLTEIDGRHWMVDPDGHLFYSIGTTGVRTTDNTIPDGREELYQQIPPKDDPNLEGVWMKGEGIMGGFSFYCWNVLRKYGNKQAWRDRVCKRFRHWGFNTIANWSEAAVMFDQQLMPYVRTTSTRTPEDDRFPMITKQLADVFDPKWIELLDEKFDREVAPYKDDPWTVGFYIDNETHWRNPKLLTAERDMAVRNEWMNFCKQYFNNDLAAAGKALDTTFSAWDELTGMTMEQIPEQGPGRDAMTAFETHYAQTMFENVNKYFRKHTPNHLYLGCRFVRQMPDPGIVKANAKYTDVVSINCYDLFPREQQFDQWYQTARKPLIIGEHQFPLASNRQLPPLYATFTEHERYEYYIQFAREWAMRPYAVGDHWFQHADQAVTGRGMDGENQLVGFVDICDQPHQDMVKAAYYATGRMYDWHLNGKS